MRSTAKSLPGRIADEIGNLLLQPPIGGLGAVRSHGARDAKRVALTYDDGPNTPSTNDVLDILAKHGVKATFFCVGENALRHPEVVKRAFREGHVIGNHSMYHSRKAGLLLGETAHIDSCTFLLTSLIGAQPLLYRAPWGWLTPWETMRLLQRGFGIIGWDVYTYDWQVPSPPGRDIADSVMKTVKPGSVVLFHDGIAGVHKAEKPTTVEATDLTIRRLKEEGYEFVTVAEMFGLQAYLSTSEVAAVAR